MVNLDSNLVVIFRSCAERLLPVLDKNPNSSQPFPTMISLLGGHTIFHLQLKFCRFLGAVRKGLLGVTSSFQSVDDALHDDVTDGHQRTSEHR